MCIRDREYAARYIEMVEEEHIPYKLNTIVIDINRDKEVTLINREDGLTTIKACPLYTSVPLRAGGYMSVLGFQKTAETLMERLVELGRKAFSEYLARMEGQRLALEEMQGGGEDGAEVAGDCGSGIRCV